MNGFITAIVVVSLLGAGLITGLLFAFSNFVMRALADLPSDKGMLAMQKINVTIINPVFMMFFLGTPLLCLAIAFISVQNINEPGSLYLFIGSLTYLIGPFGITMLFNVPLNNLLARTNASDINEIWPMYQKRWQLWNHLRTYIGATSIVLLAVGLAKIEA